LNGPWKFVFDDERKLGRPIDIKNWTHTIQVPFAPESKASGIHDTKFHSRVWYEKSIQLKKTDKRVLLHFGAVDYKAQVWVNQHFVGSHEGGHISFSFDITDSLVDGEEQIVTVCADDDPHDLAKPRGKQDWQLDPHAIWYPRTTGIWQTVWLEEVSSVYIDRISWKPFLERWEIGCEAYINGNPPQEGLKLKVKLSVEDRVLVNDSYEVISQEVHRRIALSDPGIDDYRNELLWSPEKPTLIDAELELWLNDKLIDRVESYTALRSVAVSRDRFLLNSRPYYMRLVLDQGYWPDTLMTAPSSEALRKDIELTKAAGFNGVRKHQKIEDPEYLFWADVLGLLVWVEMPSAYRFTHDSVERLMKEWVEVIDRDMNHPCVAVWVPFNESWGVPDIAEKRNHQSCVQAMYHLTRTLDPTRPVVGNDGWESTATDILGIHDYDDSPERLIKKYATEKTLADALTRYRPGGRVITVEGYPHNGQPVMLTEFGGIACDILKTNPKEWGYSICQTPEEFRKRYEILMAAVHRIELFAGFCYTQLTDTFQEANGLFTADRVPKFSLNMMAYATRGAGYTRGELNTLPQPPPLPKREELHEQTGSV
jgi:beta-galactosidase/beta-glucuronidase